MNIYVNPPIIVQPAETARQSVTPGARQNPIQTDPLVGSTTGKVAQSGAGATAGVSRTARPSGTPASPDTVHISATAHDYEMSMGDMVSRVNATPDSRTARVQALQAALAEGTYQVSAERIADAMLRQATSKVR